MASKALFAALNLDLFSRLSGGAKPLETLARDSGIAPNRLLMLLTACVGLGLLVREWRPLRQRARQRAVSAGSSSLRANH
jgi:hypothetical protein